MGEDTHPEPDPYIGLLNTDLTEMEEIIANSLPPRQARFIFDGITGLMCTVLASASDGHGGNACDVTGGDCCQIQ